MPKTKPLAASSEAIILVNSQNVLVSYYVSPTFQLHIKPLPLVIGSVTTTYSQERVYDKSDTLDEWLEKNTIPFLKLDTVGDIQSSLFFGGSRHMMSLCRIAAQRTFKKYCAMGPSEGGYQRVVEVRAMPAQHGIPGEIADGFREIGYSVADKDHPLVKSVFD